jgi:hypothetical protein
MPTWSRPTPLVAAAVLALGAGCSGTGCGGGLEPAIRQSGPEAERETDSWLDVVLARGRPGDWLVIRGYHPADHLVSGATLEPLSHAAIFDAERVEVIEAVSPVVRAVGLRSFLENAHRVVLMRPHGMTDETGREAVLRARERLGTPYDFLGTIGLPSEKRLYCSELCAWSIGMDVDRSGARRVLHPSRMDAYAVVLFDTGSRDGEPESP